MSATMVAKRERDALLDRFRRLRDEGASPARRREAYNEWFRRCCKDGFPPDALSLHSADEAERFWARTVSGLAGHVYWTGGDMFKRNDGKERSPQRWSWSKVHGELGPTDEIATTCGEPNCVNAEHMRKKLRSESRIRFSDERAFNAVKVLALQLGRTPSAREWDAAKLGITESALAQRFGGWSAFVGKAGLRPLESAPVATREVCEAAIVAMAARIGRRPNRTDWEREREWLVEHGYPTATNTIAKRVGPTFSRAVAAVLAKQRRAA